MNKAELIAAIATKAGITKEDAMIAFSATFETIADAMAKQEKIAIPGFGNFQVKVRAERKGRNPATGAEMIIPKAIVANFKPATQLKEIINQDIEKV
jgi:DNA-binding protein HU-beta